MQPWMSEGERGETSVAWLGCDLHPSFMNPHVPGQTIEASLERLNQIYALVINDHELLFDPVEVICGGAHSSVLI